MPDGFVLFEDRPVVLEVLLGIVDREGRPGGVRFAVAQAPAALIQEKTRQVEVGAVARQAIELAQADLDFLMPGKSAAPAGAEGALQEVRALERDIEERPFAGGEEMGRGRLVHMAGVIKLVADPEVRPALLAGAGSGILGVDPACREDIAVRFLGLADQLDELVEPPLELRVGPDAERDGRGLHGLENVAVVVALAGVLPFLEPGGDPEIVDAAGLLVHLEKVRDGRRRRFVSMRGAQSSSASLTFV